LRRIIVGRIDKGEKCSVNSCSNVAERSISADKVKAAGLKIGNNDNRAYLCKEHYKEYKKKSKKDKILDKWRHGV